MVETVSEFGFVEIGKLENGDVNFTVDSFKVVSSFVLSDVASVETPEVERL